MRKLSEDERRLRATARRRRWSLQNPGRDAATAKQRYSTFSKEKKAKLTAYQKRWRQENKERYTKQHRESGKEWYAENRERKQAQNRQWLENNRIKRNMWIREYSVNKRSTNPSLKIACSLRARFREVVMGKIKGRVLELLDASLDEFKIYLESQFQEGMNWGNYGHKGWHIDHIVPCSSFDLTDPKQQEICFHWSNFQPLWWWENLSKGKKIAA
jgi:hypothetical protein